MLPSMMTPEQRCAMLCAWKDGRPCTSLGCPRLKQTNDDFILTEEGRRLISKVKPTRRVRETEKGYCRETPFGMYFYSTEMFAGAKKCVKITEYEIEDDGT